MEPVAQPSVDASLPTRPEPKLIAFYLPQFHPVPENDVFWGTGYTEWSSVVRARPLFPGHYQPRLPADLGFYDLRLPEVRQAQADLARAHGIFGFCYYHYWFKGRRVLERPFDEVLKSGHPDFPFCICWANHDWTWKRGQRERGRLISQEYSEEDDKNHMRWLLRVFRDDRYIRINGRPLLLIYWPHSMPEPQRTVDTWKQEAHKSGMPEPYICKVDTFGNFDAPEKFGCDAAVEFWPHGVNKIAQRVSGAGAIYQSNTIYEYNDLVEGQLAQDAPSFRRFPCVVPDWDNTARVSGSGARILRGSTPWLYERWLGGVIEKVSSAPPQEQLVFINAWNEWAEGAYLEPDFKYGRAYLEATKRALLTHGVEVQVPGRASPGNTEARESPLPSTEDLYRDLLEKYKAALQQLMEQLSIEEHSPLVRKAEQRAEEASAALHKLRVERRREIATLQSAYDREGALRLRNEELQEQLQRAKKQKRRLAERLAGAKKPTRNRLPKFVNKLRVTLKRLRPGE